MLGVGWTEMLVIAALALIVVGPRDLPVMLRQLGRAFGIMRRMGNEFRTEFNKMAAIDEIKGVRKSLTDPLRNAQAEIQREFNKTTSTGVKPSGVLKPDATNPDSVVEAIRTQAGLPAFKPDPEMAATIEQSRAKWTPPKVPSENGAETVAKPKRKPRGKPVAEDKPEAPAAIESDETKAAAKPKVAASAATASATATPKRAAKAAAKPKAPVGVADTQAAEPLPAAPRPRAKRPKRWPSPRRKSRTRPRQTSWPAPRRRCSNT
ncbi:MAG: Sec-independent protein translocase protein TatB [Alphaproteobacteria bacterium]|nr:Sec-independent protein translocase protein TatB [Alphaproteobacteria bacterium]